MSFNNCQRQYQYWETEENQSEHFEFNWETRIDNLIGSGPQTQFLLILIGNFQSGQL